MKRLFIALLLMLPFAAIAQESYDQGSYWSVTSVDTKPTKFNAYIEDLNGLWRKQMDMMKEAGKVKSYTMFSNVNAREGEPDLWLFVEWTSAGAMMDTPFEEWQGMTTKLTGSVEKSRELGVKRGEIRTIMSNILLRELSFK